MEGFNEVGLFKKKNKNPVVKLCVCEIRKREIRKNLE